MLIAASSAPTSTADAVDSASTWFESNSHALITAAVIVVAAVILNWIVRRAIRRTVDGLANARAAKRSRQLPDTGMGRLERTEVERLQTRAIQSERAEQRARTLGSLLRYVATITIVTVAVLMVLAELGVSIAPLLAGAGVAGVALGFGAQSLVKDFLSGIFMLMEDQYGVGDFIDVGEASGTVERVTLRVTTMRDVNGTVWYVPNGEIRRVGNLSQLWSRIVLDVEVAYDTDIAAASEVIKRVADEEWRAQRPGGTIIEEPELWGVERFDPSAVVIRLAVKTRPGEQWAAGRALRARLKDAFDEAGIVIPFPQQTVWLRGPSGARDGADKREEAEPDDADSGDEDSGDAD